MTTVLNTGTYGAPRHQSFVARIPSVLPAVADVRRRLQQQLLIWACPKNTDLVVLVAHELVANAVRHGCRHAREEVRLVVHRMGNRLLITVEDPSPAVPPPRPVTDDALDGRGLPLIDAVAASWGYRLNEGGVGKKVWCLVITDASQP